MNPSQLLQHAEDLLRRTGRSVQGKGHYRTVRLPGGRELAVDVFGDGPNLGHVRVHVYNVSPAEAARLEAVVTSPPIGSPRRVGCPKCSGLPARFPCGYRGPARNSNRHYFGFQWHTAPELTPGDAERMDAALRCLLDLFPV